MTEPRIAHKNIWVAAHRGNSRYFPENTLASFSSALTLPVDQIEIDLQMSKDGEIMMFHGRELSSTSNGNGLVSEYTCAELKKLDAGSWKGSEFAGEQIPTLREFLELLRPYPEMTLNIELKDFPHTVGTEFACASADRTVAMVEEYGLHDRVWINCMSAPMLEYLDAKYDHTYRLHGLWPHDKMFGDRTRDPYDYLSCVCLFGTREEPVVDQSEFDRAVSRNVEPWVHYPDDSLDSYERSVDRGALLITANDPAKAIDYLASRGMHRAC